MVGLTGNNLAIGIALVLRDQFSVGARQATQTLGQLQSKADRAAMESARNMNAIGAGMGLAVMSGMRDWLRAGLEFDKQMTYTYSVADKVGGITTKKLRDRAKDVGVQTLYSAQEVSEAMVVMAQAGQNTEQIYENIYATAVLGAATMSGIRESASTMNDIMIGFNIPATEANAMRVADIITKTINDSNIALDAYSETMKYTIPTAKTLGVTLEELSSITSVLGNAGLKGSMAGTGTENMIRLLAISAGKEEGTKQMDALKRMGLGREDIVDVEGNLRSLSEIFPKLGRGLQSMGNADRIKTMADLFNIRGARPGQLLTFAEGLERYKTALDGVNNSMGTAHRTSRDMMESAWGQAEQLEESIGNLKIAFTEALTPVLLVVLPALTQALTLVRDIMGTNFGKLMVTVATGFLLWKTASMGYRTILYSIRLLSGQLGTTFAATAASTVRGYSSMTAAANTYRNAAAGAAMVGGAGMGIYGAAGAAGRYKYARGMGAHNMGPAVWNAKRKQWTTNNWGISRDAALSQRYLQRYGSGARLANINNLVGRATPIGMMAGLGLSVGQSLAPEGSGAGRAMGVGATVLGGASTGAMLGSVVPGVGNVVGAIVGGVGGLLWGLYDDAKQEEERIKAAKEAYEADKAARPDGFDVGAWKQNAQTYLRMQEGDEYVRSGDGISKVLTPGDLQNQQLLQRLRNYQDNNPNPPKTNITINIDGREMMREEIEKEFFKTFINLGG